MNTETCVSIVTPSYNSERFIGLSIESVLSQTYTNWEMLIVDDASTDRTVSIAERYGRGDDRIKLIRLKQNSGVASARNTGIREAQGRFIAFLDSDDLWMPEKLEKQVRFMEKNNASLACTAYLKMNAEGVVQKRFIDVPNKITYPMILKSNRIGCLTAMVDVRRIGKHYMSDVGHEDYTLWLKILKRGHIAYGLNLPLAIYRMRNASLSGNKLKASRFQWKIYREIEKISFINSLIFFAQYAYYGFKKYQV